MVELDGSGAAPLEAEDPRRIGEIALAGRLGAGGMGRVFLGVSEGRYVAVKQLLASVVGEDEDFVRRFGHELDNLARLPAEATAPLLASDRTARPPWFATAYVPGLTLREALDVHGGPLPAPSLWRLLREAAASLAPVHALDMVHRDLKPSNVMLTLDGLTLIDFGVARAAEQSRLTRTGMVVGTPAYMAPEQASGARGLSGATDVFALGSVLAYAACGRPPFGEESGHGVLYRIVHEEPGLEPLRELDAELAELVGACLAKDPGDRPGAAELLERASRHVPEGGPLWPEAVTGRLSERAAFAERVQEVDVPTLPLGGKGPGTPEPEPEPKAKPEPEPAQAEPVQAAGSGGGEPARRGRRARVLLAVVPVVVVASGTTLAIQNLPFASAPPSKAEAGAAPQGSGAASVPAPGGPSAPASASASAPAPGATPSGPPSPGAPSPGGQAPGGTGQGAAGAPQGGGPGPAPGTGPGTGTGPAPGTGNAAGGANPSGGGGSTPAPPPPATGAGRYRNGNNGECITQVFGASDSGDCGDGSARWAVRSRPDGSFKLVNEQSGQCLYSNGPNQAVFVGDCAQDVGRLWRSGPGGTLRDSAGACLDLGFGGGLNTASCDGDASQRWSRQS
ncbi:serine/threonine protein kinase [Streptomyces sp. Ag109_G2-6]|uniref:serine/threonine-protein kinase n=1 Tax=Streptomyces sp. Ag109_G2-6 TaxID=2485154 RepID=UPI000F506582|nr:serine/threonine protein kinase [Streptomyces sp. Ag109_G2-6]RPF25508.1 serine/threonine protein kinase [Streptomyces sp. Ag109_G2-6]